MTPDEQKQHDDEHQRILKLLVQLNQTEAFQLWRDMVCKPLLDQLEARLQDSDTMDEATLRGSLKHYFSEKYRFQTVFDQATTQLMVDFETEQLNP